MLRTAEGAPVRSNQRPLRMIVSYGIVLTAWLDLEAAGEAA